LHFQDQAPTLDEDTRKRLHVGTDEPVHRRRVELMRGELVLSEADNWFLPGRLAPSMRELLATTTIPFGKIVERLRPMRRTFLVIFSDLPPSSDATAFRGGGVDAGPARAGASLPRIVLEHRAIVLRADLKPIAIVHERYRSELIGGAASLHARPQPSGGSKEPRSP
jgi:hypothetical protein